MKPPKESKSERQKRLQETEGGRRFRAETWSANGNIKDPKRNRRKTNLELKRNYL